MRFNTAAILSLSILMSACATYPQSREEQAAYYADKAAAAFSKGDNTQAAS